MGHEHAGGPAEHAAAGRAFLGVGVEVWPVTADPAGIWLISGTDALRSYAIAQDTDPHATAEGLLAEKGALASAKLLHSTSWRAEGTLVVLTYIAVIACSELARSHWPDAKPVSAAVPAAVGKPFAVGATEAPLPRHIDVLMHGLRHLRFLLHTDSAAQSTLCGTWRDHPGRRRLIPPRFVVPPVLPCG